MATNPLDELDLRILEQLQLDCSLTNQALALRVHASAPTCLRRVRRLVRHGFIARRVAILNPMLMGSTLTALIEVTLDSQAADKADAIRARLVAESCVQQCYRVTSGPDFMVIALLPDMAAYQEFARRCLTSDPHVRNVRSFFATERCKFETRLPIQAGPR